MNVPRKLVMEDLMQMDPARIDMEELKYNGFSGLYCDTEPQPGQIRVACVGDSITYGHGIYNWPENNYPQVLQKLLGDGFHVRNFGICGRCVQDDTDQPYRAEERYRQSLEYGADIVVLMMGTNDSKPQNWHGAAAFTRAFHQLALEYVRLPKQPRVFLCKPSAAFFANGFGDTVTTFDVQPKIVAHIADLIQETAREQNYPLIDIGKITAENPQWFDADSVHPDREGAAAIAGAVYQAICSHP